MNAGLYWLPEAQAGQAFRAKLREIATLGWAFAVGLASQRLDFIQTNQLDGIVRAQFPAPPADLPTKPIRLAILGSCTTTHLHPAIRTGGLRRNLHVSVFEADYGQYWQELLEPSAELRAFKPTALLLALDAYHLAAGLNAAMPAPAVDAAFDELCARLKQCWQHAKAQFRGPVIQHVPLNIHPKLAGSNEHRLPGSPAAFIARLNAALPALADEAGIELLNLPDLAAGEGLGRWHDAGLWHRAKQEISLIAAPAYGDALARLLGAAQGRSFKCLVLDLDNTLWGGVIGDDGLEGIVLGQGSALGEAYASFQDYCRQLSQRGIILAVCSKNDEANALEPFTKHPEMVLRRGDIACFVANWTDKASNIRTIAQQLNIGLDAMVFVDDNPFERTQVREALPMVAVPEVGDDPAGYIRALSDAGYFEALAFTPEDFERSGQYQGNQLREQLRASATDLTGYLQSLQMRMVWRRFDRLGLARIVQLINKTNQFNLRTQRYTEDDVLAVMQDERAFGLQIRLLDRFGDNGIIAIIIGKMVSGSELLIDTWLMSCRVLGRQVEAATLNLVAAQARALGASRLIGEYLPTAKNAMVRDHYEKLGFEVMHSAPDGATRAVLDLTKFTPAPVLMDLEEG